jgi:low temperature requirement protein LtrA
VEVLPKHRHVVDDLGVLEPHGRAVTSNEVTPLDLLFDLVYVFGISQLSHHLLTNPTWYGALETFVLLVAVFALWLQTTWTVILRAAEGRDGPWLLLIILPIGLFMNASIDVAFGWGGWVFVGLYVSVTAVRDYWVVVSGLRPWVIDHHQRMLMWLAVSAVGWIVGAADEAHRLAWWAFAAIVDLLGIVTAHVTPWRRLHSERQVIPRTRTFERARLFFLIALGETILTTGVAIAAELHDPLTIVTGLVALTGSVALWWTYFDAKEPARRQALGASDDPTRYSVGTFNLLFGMVAAMIVIAVGDELVIAHPLGHTDVRLVVLVFGGPVLYLAVQAGQAIWQRSPVDRSRSRVIALIALVVLGGLSLRVPPFVAAVFAAAPLVGVAINEARGRTAMSA